MLFEKKAIHLTSSLQSLVVFQFLYRNIKPLDNIVALITFPHLSVCTKKMLCDTTQAVN